MSHRSRRLLLAVVAAALIWLVSTPAAAQNQPLHFDPITNARALCPDETRNNVGKTKDRLTALPPHVIEPQKTPEGWPDLQGTWNSGSYPGSAEHSLEVGTDPLDIAVQCQPLEKLDYLRSNMLVIPMKGRIPYQPWAKAKQMDLLAGIYAPQRRMDLDPEVLCFLVGIPHAMMRGGGAGTIELRYIPGAVVILSNKGTRIIPMDATPHLNPDIALFMGDPRGHWEGHTLVIETTNNRENTWFDKHGTFHGEALHVIERLTMVSQDSLYYEVTLADPMVFTQPWRVVQNFDRQKRAATKIFDPEGHEDTCHESDTSVDRTVRAGILAKAAGLHGYHIHVDLVTGKAVDPADQSYLDESGQPAGYSFAPGLPDMLFPQPKGDSSPQ